MEDFDPLDPNEWADKDLDGVGDNLADPDPNNPCNPILCPEETVTVLKQKVTKKLENGWTVITILERTDDSKNFKTLSRECINPSGEKLDCPSTFIKNQWNL